MESAFDHDFARVRVHDDARAAALSRDLDARAFTVGDHVAFAHAAYRPGARRGDELLAHELAHVVQQTGGSAAVAASQSGSSATNASPSPDQAIEADADRAAHAVVQSLHGRSQPAGERGPQLRDGVRVARSPAPPRGPANYDDVKHTIIAMPRGLSVADMEANLQQEKAAGTIVSWRADGVRAGSDEQVYILYAIWQLSHAKFWDREVDLATEIAPNKRGAITVRIDASGNAVGSLTHTTVPAVATTYATVADAITGLKARYKLKEISAEKSKTWSLDDLNKVAAAWSRLLPADAAVLENFTVIRTDDSLHTDDGTPAAGLTTTGTTVAPDQMSSTRVREIRFADRAFGSDSVAFVGDTADAAPISVQTILHEVGHAQERKLAADANSAYVEAQVAQIVAAQAANKSAQAALDTMNAAVAAWGKLKPAQRNPTKAYVATFRAAFAAIDALRAEPQPTAAAPLQVAARAAIDARNRARDALPATSPALAVFAKAQQEQDAYLAAAEALLGSRTAVETTKTQQTAVKDPTGSRSARLERFVNFVNSKGIKRFTKYARDNWPSHPEEFYAEAFSFWRADPTFLASSSPDLKQWFDSGEHLK